MITGNRLDIFDRFQVDPKLRPGAPITDVQPGLNMTSNVVLGIDFQGSAKILDKGLWARIKRWWMSNGRNDPKEISVAQFFSSVKNNVEELKIVQERAQGYAEAIHQAQMAGQQALVESLERNLRVARTEAQLAATGAVRFVSEETIVKFAKQTKRGLRLDWIKNFARPLPNDVLEVKLKTDGLGIFDNYVVLHYDPDGRATQMTEAEVAEAKKDPILFGVIENRRRLYFIADWVDEQCDLTLDQIADTLGSKAIEHLK